MKRYLLFLTATLVATLLACSDKKEASSDGDNRDLEKANKELAVADECLRKAQTQSANSKKDSLQALELYQAIAKKYSNKAGNRAKLMAGQILYAQGKYDETQKYLEDYTPEGKIVGPMSQALLGDVYVNQKQYDKAITAYDKAIYLSKMNENHDMMPIFMQKKAHVLEFIGKYDDALKIYEEIETKYTGPNSMYNSIERVKAKSGK